MFLSCTESKNQIAMRKLSLFLLLWLPSLVMAQEWELITPENVNVNSFNFNPLQHRNFTSGNNLYVYNTDWSATNTANLTITDSEALNDSVILVTAGSGSYSDGLYKYNCLTGEDTLVEWFNEPQFVKKIYNTWYIGTRGALYESSDGHNWNEMVNLSYSETVLDFYLDATIQILIIREENITKNSSQMKDFIKHSVNGGEDWEADTLPLWYQDAAFDYWHHKLYLALGENGTYSDGVYVSDDHGATLENLEYFIHISSIYLISDAYLAVGMHESNSSNGGVNILNLTNMEVTGLSNNLPQRNILSISMNPHVDCQNIVACTDSGAYQTFDLTGVSTPAGKNSLSIYPNPTEKEITINTITNTAGNMRLTISDLSGRIVHQAERFIHTAGEYQWKTTVNMLSQGIYIVTVANGEGVLGKQKLIKQ